MPPNICRKNKFYLKMYCTISQYIKDSIIKRYTRRGGNLTCHLQNNSLSETDPYTKILKKHNLQSSLMNYIKFLKKVILNMTKYPFSTFPPETLTMQHSTKSPLFTYTLLYFTTPNVKIHFKTF